MLALEKNSLVLEQSTLVLEIYTPDHEKCTLDLEVLALTNFQAEAYDLVVGRLVVPGPVLGEVLSPAAACSQEYLLVCTQVVVGPHF